MSRGGGDVNLPRKSTQMAMERLENRACQRACHCMCVIGRLNAQLKDLFGIQKPLGRLVCDHQPHETGCMQYYFSLSVLNVSDW
jgi:hypothetical protein